MRIRALPITVLAAAALGLGIAACDEATTGPEDGARVRILLTDAPADYIESAEIWVSAVYLQRRDDDAEGDPRVYLFDDAANPRTYDLMLLRDGVTADLTGDVELEPGAYGQLRLIVDSAFVTLKEGYAFNDGSTTASLKVPSGSRSGIKVQLNEDIDAEAGELVDLIVDFDVNENFKLQGNPETPAGIHGMLFTPVLKEKSRSVEDDDGV
jgi:hypothetical protein